jgi:copper chaperone
LSRAKKAHTILDLSLPGMTCQGCVRGVTASIKALGSDAEVKADLTTHSVHVRTTAPEPEIREAMADGGYVPA